MKTRLLTLSPAKFCKATFACEDGATFAAKYSMMADVWDNCPRPDWFFWIIDTINAPIDDKAMRLFACWCVRETPLSDGRKVWDLLTDERSRNAVMVAERYAYGLGTEKDRYSAWAAAGYAARDPAGYAAGCASGGDVRAAAWDAAWAAAWAAPNATSCAASCPTLSANNPNPALMKKAIIETLICCIVGLAIGLLFAANF